MRRWLLLLAVGVLVAATACSSGEDTTPTTQGQDQNTDDGGSDDGGSGGDGGGNAGAPAGDGMPDSVVDDFPVEIPAGWEVDIQGEIGMTNAGSAQLLYPDDAFEDLVAFYDDWTAAHSDEFARTELEGQVIYTGGDSEIVTISITPNHQERDQTWTLLQVFTSGEG